MMKIITIMMKITCMEKQPTQLVQKVLKGTAENVQYCKNYFLRYDDQRGKGLNYTIKIINKIRIYLKKKKMY